MKVGNHEGFWSLGVQSRSLDERHRIDLLGHHLRRYYDDLKNAEIPEHLRTLARSIDHRVAQIEAAGRRIEAELHRQFQTKAS